MNDVQAQANRMHVRMLLQQRQPDFAAMLESMAREFAPESIARRIDRAPRFVSEALAHCFEQSREVLSARIALSKVRGDTWMALRRVGSRQDQVHVDVDHLREPGAANVAGIGLQEPIQI